MAPDIERPDPAPITVQVVRHDDHVVVTLRGELDLDGIDDVEAQVAPVLRTAPTHLIVDVGELAFADSGAISLWLHWAGTVERFELRHPSPIIARVLDAMGLSEKLGVPSR